MKKTSLQKASIGASLIAMGVSLGAMLVLDTAFLAPAAEAGCRPTGRYVGGLPVLRCTGRTRCRPTGRFKRVGGRRYPILSCPRR
jgi:hypothetical protein